MDGKFCTGCGETVEPGMQFCPHCGKVVSGSAADEEMKKNEKLFFAEMVEARRNLLVFIIAIYAIPAIIAGIISLFDAPSLANSIWANESFQRWIADHGFKFDLNDVRNYLTYGAALTLASGQCALVSAILVYTKKYWIVATVACFLAAILCFWSVLGLIVGILVGFMVFEAKGLFTDSPAQADEKPE